MRGALAPVAAGVALGLDAALAVAADRSRPDVSVTLDLAVAAAFVVGALLADGPAAQRRLMTAVGAAWLLGSWLPGTALLHQGVLLVALLAYPSGRLRGRQWLVVGLAACVVPGLVQQIGVATAFAVTAGWRAVRRDGESTFPVTAALAVAAVLATSWTVAAVAPQTFDPALFALAWQILLVTLGAGFAAATHQARHRRLRLADVVLAGPTAGSAEAFGRVLADALGDPTLRVLPAGRAAERAADPVDRSPASRRDRLVVRDGDRPAAVVVHRPGLLADPATAHGVHGAVRLWVANAGLRAEEARQLAELERSRARLIAATDRTRDRMAAALLDDVRVPVRRVAERLARLPREATLDLLRAELDRVDGAVGELLAGVPPAGLGGGGLRAVLGRLAERTPLPVTVAVSGDASGDRTAETTLFYVCSESLTNVTKHAGATGTRIELVVTGGLLRLTVRDDGRGGADVQGSGLRGLADRLAGARGRLQVRSAPGAGTVVVAEVPAVSEFSSTA